MTGADKCLTSCNLYIIIQNLNLGGQRILLTADTAVDWERGSRS